MFLPSPSSLISHSLRHIQARGQTLVEKIVQRYAVDLPAGHTVHAGDFVYIRPAHVMTHDNTGAVMAKCATPTLRSA